MDVLDKCIKTIIALRDEPIYFDENLKDNEIVSSRILLIEFWWLQNKVKVTNIQIKVSIFGLLVKIQTMLKQPWKKINTMKTWNLGRLRVT